MKKISLLFVTTLLTVLAYAQCGITGTPVVTNVSCNGGSNGAINITISGGTPFSSSPTKGMLISEVFADPAGSDGAQEFVELVVAKPINFATTPYTVIFVNNGTATANGWVAGGVLTYAFQINSGSVNAGDVVYVGGSAMAPTVNVIRSINNTTTAGDGGIGSINANGVIGNGGGNADAVALFDLPVASINNGSVPVDAIFFGSGIGGAVVSSGAAGYQLPVNDNYNGGKLQTTSFLAPNSSSGSYLKATGAYNVQTNTFTTPRTWANTTTFTNLATSVSLQGLYNYSWSNGQVTEDINGLAPGTYNLTITDALGCTGTATATVTEPTALSSTISSTPSGCTTATGTATVVVSGGTPNYTYNWSPSGGTAATAPGLAAGPYTVTFSDANGCTGSNSVTVGTSGFSVDTNIYDVSCNGANDGAAAVIVTGGTAPIGYTWTGAVSTTDSAFGLAAGSYTVTVSDNGGCTETISFTINEPAALQITGFNAVLPTCFSNCNGSATATISGGTGAYTYLWSNGQTTNPATNLCAGAYGVTVTDANGCTASAQATITQPAQIGPDVSVVNPSCNAACNGSATSNPYGGSGVYTYLWNTGDTTQTIDSLCPGSYGVTVTDNNGCTGSQNFLLVPLSSTLTATFSSTDATCFGDCNGTAIATPANGNPPYTFLWGNGNINDTATTLCAGTYPVTITDATGCSYVDQVTIGEPTQLVISATADSALCFGSCDGEASVTISGGTPGYMAMWSNGAMANSINSLCAGNYDVTVSDQNNCTVSTNVTVGEPAEIVADITFTNPLCAGDCNGNAIANITGGTPQYFYSWANIIAIGNTVSNLCAGELSLIVTDLNGCQGYDTVTLVEPAPLEITYTVTNATCSGVCDGIIATTVTGGTPNYNYLWSNGNSVPTYTNACAGNINLSVTDANNCRLDTSFLVTEPLPLSVSLGPDTASCDVLELCAPSGFASYAWSNGVNSSCITLQAVFNGDVAVTVTNGSGCTASDTINVNLPICPGIRDAEMAAAWIIYPNPAQQQLYIKSTDVAIDKIELIDLQGRTVLTKLMPANNELNISTLVPGMYYVRVNGVSTKVFVKE
jgi:hypothetical protein